jgi:hypothetical protein
MFGGVRDEQHMAKLQLYPFVRPNRIDIGCFL